MRTYTKLCSLLIALLLVAGAAAAGGDSYGSGDTEYNYYDDYEYNYDYSTTYNQTYYSTEENQYNYDYSTIYNTSYNTYNTYNTENNEYTYNNTYTQHNTYVFYRFGGDCPDGGCQYTCQDPSCSEYRSDTEEPVVTAQGVDLEIVEATYPSQIHAGDEIDFTMTVENRGDLDAADMELRIRAYGQEKTVSGLQLLSGDAATFNVNFTLPTTASGPETVELEAAALNQDGGLMERDLATVTISPDDVYATLRVSPDRAVVGDNVELHGMLNARNVPANLYVNGFHIATVQSGEMNRYSHTIQVQGAGMHRVELRSGNVRETAFLRVDPDLGITDLNVPETVSTRDRFDVCGTVFKSTAGQVNVEVLVDGQTAETDTVLVSGEEEVCLRTALEQSGEHEIGMRIASDTVSDTQTQTVQAVESRVEVNVFPQQLTVERGGSGLFQVALRNRDAQPRTFRIQVSGMGGIAETTDTTLSLGSQESRNAHVRVSPSQSGVYQGNITVTSEDFTFADTQVRVYAAENPAMKGRLSGARRAISDAVTSVRDRSGTIAGLLAVIILGVVGVLLYRRYRRRGVIEPRY